MSVETLLSSQFDVVVMLTWSDWYSEPRSNRYHYASRFAQELPVLFVQPWEKDEQVLVGEPLQSANIEIIHYSSTRSEEAATQLVKLLGARGFQRPLVWIYNARDYAGLHGRLARKGNCFFVFHATEDYFTNSHLPDLQNEIIGQWVKNTLHHVHLTIGVSQKVTETYKRNADADMNYAVVENGCDASGAEAIRKQLPSSIKSDSKTIIYQGGINSRLDFELLNTLVLSMPDWLFKFCGREDASIEAWSKLKKLDNVIYLGELEIEALGKEIFCSTVGLIPFVQNEWIRGSLPLKAYEYVSYGLPVVTVPIDALAESSPFFEFARSAQEFLEKILEVATTRSQPDFIEARYQKAKRNSYDQRFDEAKNCILESRLNLPASPPLNVVVLYDERHTYVSTIREHLESFSKYSTHNFFFVPATGIWPIEGDGIERAIDLSVYDVVIVHYSARISLPDYFNEDIAIAVEKHPGTKILFIQDEYEKTETARKWMDRFRFNIVFTCVPLSEVEKVYPKHRFPQTDFRSTLTGYVPESQNIDRYVTPLGDRDVVIAYRGRKLPFVYGELGYEKYRIGKDVKEFATAAGVKVDIEVDDSRRIYGDNWYKFLGSARATLGTESGSSIFDFTGEVAKELEGLTRYNHDMPFEDVQQKLLYKYSDYVHMNQISPKIFEAIRLRTALVLFEGEYSGVVQPDLHYIKLMKDYSNIHEVFEKLKDLEFLEAMTKRAYDDVIASDKYSYRSFVKEFDKVLSEHHFGWPKYKIITRPTFAVDSFGKFRSLVPNHSLGYTLASWPLGEDVQREDVMELVQSSVGLDGKDAKSVFKLSQQEQAKQLVISDQWRETLRGFARFIPSRLRARLKAHAIRFVHRSERSENTDSADFKIVRWIWHTIPVKIRVNLVGLFRSDS